MRTKNNNELRLSNVGEIVTLVGWCSKKRNLGGLIFIDLRDRKGITQLVVEPDNKMYEIANSVRNEYVLKATGKVVERQSKNPNLPTGDVEVIADEITIINVADTTPLIIALSVIGGVIVLGVAGWFIFKKYKENHEVIK